MIWLQRQKQCKDFKLQLRYKLKVYMQTPMWNFFACQDKEWIPSSRTF